MQADHRLDENTDNWIMEFIIYGNETSDTPDDESQLGLVSVIFEQGTGAKDSNDFIAALKLDTLRSLADDSNKEVEQTLDSVPLLTGLLNSISGSNVYSYFGKVTTPPCDNAYWYIFE